LTGRVAGRAQASPAWRVRVLTEDDWWLLRIVRLRALKESPRAFLSDYQTEAGYVETQWRHLIGGGMQWFVAFGADQQPVGVAAARRDSDYDDRWYIESMWVAPKLRTLGVARCLIRVLVHAVRLQGVSTVLLWVLDGNDVARSAYLALGFVPTGHTQGVGANRTEELLELLLN
jgi:GNAT superfamily N-acetyltransferase